MKQMELIAMRGGVLFTNETNGTDDLAGAGFCSQMKQMEQMAMRGVFFVHKWN